MRWVGNRQTGQWTSACIEVRRNVSWAAVSSSDHVSKCSGRPAGSKHATRSIRLSLVERADLSHVSFPRIYIPKRGVGEPWKTSPKVGKNLFYLSNHTCPQ